MRTTIFLLSITLFPLKLALACDVPPADTATSTADEPKPDTNEPLVWPREPSKKLLQGMWLAPNGEDNQKLLWLREDGSWTTAIVLANGETIESLDYVDSSRDPWHIDRLDDSESSYALVLGQPRPTRCGQGSTIRISFSIQRITENELVLRTPGESAVAFRYARAPKTVETQIARLVDEASKPKATADTGRLKDGIYAAHYEGEGVRARRSDGAEIILAERLTDRFGNAAMHSVSNDNTRFNLDLKNAGPIPAKRTAPYFVVILDGQVLAVAGHTDPHPDGTMDFGAQVFGVEVAKAVEQRLNIQARRRTHPGHRLLTTWSPAKDRYRVGEAVTLRMEIKNVGDKPVSFRVGGQQRGPRDNQFRFLAYRTGGWGDAIPDTGDPTNHGGLSTWQDLKPGEVFKHEVDLSRWFNFTEPDSYRITGLFELELVDPNPNSSHRETIWEDFTVGDCTVYVEGEQPQ